MPPPNCRFSGNGLCLMPDLNAIPVTGGWRRSMRLIWIDDGIGLKPGISYAPNRARDKNTAVKGFGLPDTLVLKS